MLPERQRGTVLWGMLVGHPGFAAAFLQAKRDDHDKLLTVTSWTCPMRTQRG